MFVGLKIITIFAACSNMNERPKIRKKVENNEFLQLKNMNDTEIKEWQTQTYSQPATAKLLICRKKTSFGVSKFSFLRGLRLILC